MYTASVFGGGLLFVVDQGKTKRGKGNKIMDRPCKACRKPLRFMKNEAGKLVPLDLRAPVYEVKRDFSGEPSATLVQEGFYVSHFATCPSANDFSKGGKSRGA